MGLFSRFIRPLTRVDDSPKNGNHYGIIGDMECKVNKTEDTDGSDDDGLSFFQGVCVVINVVMGCGFLGLPRLVSLSGVALGPIIILAVCITLTITTGFEGEIMCRAQALEEFKHNPSEIGEMRSNPLEAMRIKRSFSMVEMCELLSGTALKRIYNTLIGLYLFCTMLAYTTVFSTAMSHHIPIPFIFRGQTCANHEGEDGCTQLHNFYIALFAVFVIPLSMVGVKEQVSFQVCMTALRFCAGFLMAGTCLYGFYSGNRVFDSSIPENQNIVLFSFSHTFQMLTPALFAQNMNAFVSIVVHDLKDKNSIGKVGRIGMLATCALYCSLGICVALYLGAAVPQTSNVIWAHFTGGVESSVLVRAVASFIILFPALDVLSIFPLNGIAMATNMMAGVYHDKVVHAEKDKFIVRFFRFCCTAPPIVLAILVGDNLDKVLVYAGSCVIPLAMIIPSYLNFVSQEVVQEKLGFKTSKTHLTSIFSGQKSLACIAVIGSVLLVVSIVQNANATM